MNYQDCTVEDLAKHVEASPSSRITQQLTYYRKVGNEEMVEKILEARKIVKKRKLLKLLESLSD